MLMAMPALLQSLVLMVLAAALTILGNHLLHPMLERYALARPNARSSHSKPTAQGGGIAVVGVTLALFVWMTWDTATPGIDHLRLAMLVGGAGILALVGLVDDVQPLPVLVRLVLQACAAVMMVDALPPESTPLARFELPELLEWTILAVGLVWFINLTNFMDGIDWMSVAEVVPITLTLALLAHVGALPKAAGLLALLLAGAMIGFAPANRHVAKLFLGDVGSLPIGGLVGWMLIVLAGAGHLAAALILPMYYILDSGITLLRRIFAGEKVWQSHRSHFYQRGLDKGFAVPEITTEVLRLNVALSGLASLAVVMKDTWVSIGTLVLAVIISLMLLQRLERGPQRTAISDAARKA